jgi:SNF2 family DNA or RNA helicase
MTQLWNHQGIAADKALQHKGFLLGHDMGTGKSCTAIHIANRLDAKKVLVLSPKTVVSVWGPQFDLHSDRPYKTVALDKGKVSKKAARVLQELDLAHAANSRVVICVNYESAWRAPLGPVYNQRNRIINRGALMSTQWDLVILDEIHRIKGPGSKVSWFCKSLGLKANRRLGLTGTPAPNSPLDFYAQFRFLDPSIFGTSFVGVW